MKPVGVEFSRQAVSPRSAIHTRTPRALEGALMAARKGLRIHLFHLLSYPVETLMITGLSENRTLSEIRTLLFRLGVSELFT